jgi:hypothetical protein
MAWAAAGVEAWRVPDADPRRHAEREGGGDREREREREKDR